METIIQTFKRSGLEQGCDLKQIGKLFMVLFALYVAMGSYQHYRSHEYQMAKDVFGQQNYKFTQYASSYSLCRNAQGQTCDCGRCE